MGMHAVGLCSFLYYYKGAELDLDRVHVRHFPQHAIYGCAGFRVSVYRVNIFTLCMYVSKER